MSLRSRGLSRLLACALLACAGVSAAQSNGPAFVAGEKAPWEAAFRLQESAATATRVTVEAPDASEIQLVRIANSRATHKRVEIGIGREVPAVAGRHARALSWAPAAGGHAARWKIASAGASALRVAIAGALPPGAELRAGGSGDGRVYGPFTGAHLRGGADTWWSPVLEGEAATLEVYVPAGTDPAGLGLEVARVSYLFASPSNPKAELVAKAAGACEVNFICRASSDAALAQAGRAVARIDFTQPNGNSSMCTGTLLNPSSGSTPYFATAAHCVAAESTARTLNTHWFYEATACPGNTGLNPAYTQVPGGATLLHASETSDVSFMRLNASPPGGAVAAGWDASPVVPGQRITGIHHPQGDVKKVSLGRVLGFDTSSLAPGGSFVRVHWDSAATGVVEGGSSGSGIFSGDSSSGYRFRGGLNGGASDCSAPADFLYDYYWRMDHAFPFIAPFLSPANAPALGANAVANPGFEGGASTWTQSSSAGAALIASDASQSRSGAWHGRLGGANSVTETLAQSLTVPHGPARVQFWHRISTSESATASAFDRLTLDVVNASGAVLLNLGAWSNRDASAGWAQSPVLDISAFAGQSVRLQFRATTDFSEVTTFRIDDVTLNGAPLAPATNNTALYWNPLESGWGLNVTQQGNLAFATLFTYDPGGAPLWLVMPAGERKGGSETFVGDLYRTTGPPFDASPFTPIGPANVSPVGTMTVDFNGGATLGYELNGAYVSKSIQKQVFGARAATCQPVSGSGSRAGATNYQDLWWNAAESGWGLNLTHQGDVIFATLFTYGANGQGIWLVMPSGSRQPDGSYSGDLLRTSGPSFDANPWLAVGSTRVGAMRLRFADGESGTLEYSVDGVSVTKAIARQVFSSPLPLCS